VKQLLAPAPRCHPERSRSSGEAKDLGLPETRAQAKLRHHEFHIVRTRGVVGYELRARSLPTLLIDADDTLWENNIYFERAIARFISFLNHHEFSPEQVREVLNDVERECIVTHGYGLHSFAHALVRTFERLSVQPVTPEMPAQIQSFAHTITDHAIELLPEVEETLAYLAPRNRLIMVTKGAVPEQSGKIERSGLKKYFTAVEIVAEKDPTAYSVLVEKYKLQRDSTWMIGNSPKSDINPALAAGLHAVFVPHGDTWILEHEDLSAAPSGQKLLIVGSFAELREHF
jgi:putative hydrolase of the HAD superfamily